MGDVTQRIRWFDLDDFDMEIPICDFCSDILTEFPRPVKGSYALCVSCQGFHGIKKGHTEYFESFGYNSGMEKRKMGTNCGGR